MATIKRTHLSETPDEKEHNPRIKTRGLEQSNQQLDPLTIQQARLDPKALKPDEVQHLQQTFGNLEVDRLLTPHRSNQRLHRQTGNILQAPSPSQVIQRSDFIVTPAGEKKTLTGKMCWDAVAYRLMLDKLITPDQYAHWGNTIPDALTKLVNTEDTIAINPNIPDENIIGIFRRYKKNEEPRLSHVMLSLGGGLAVGSNNGCIGGSPAWSFQDLGDKLVWPSEGGNPSVGPTRPEEPDNPSVGPTRPKEPDWARERFVYYRPVATAVARF
ncbi:MAG: hypothetical protein MUO62_09860 [Anaerolineales bacterium]|nr:hypothetical protein [Anaerolineales bacterium]